MIHARTIRWAALAALFFGGGCMPFDPPRPAAPLRPPRATLSDITAPLRGPDELDRLPETQPGQLRRAFILMRTKRASQAIHVLNRILYAEARPGPGVRALTLYLRGHAFGLTGDRDRAREDLGGARSLAVGARLRDRCTEELQRLGEPAVAHAKAAPPAAPGVTILPRSSWNAARPVMPRMNPMHGIQRLTIHHTANLSRSTTPAVVATQIRGIQQHHVAQNAWGDIGYHFLIDPAGRVWEGRDTLYQGAHAGGANNRHNVGICLLGRFIGGAGGQHPTPAQIQAMEQLVLWLRLRHDLSGDAILTHREMNHKTDCPGSHLQLQVDRMRQRHAALVAGRHGAGATPGGGR